MRSTESPDNRRFKSKVDRWLGAILVLTPVATTVGGIAMVVAGENVFAALAPVLFIGALYGTLVYPLYYELEPESLLIRFGLIRSRIRYGDIRRVVPTNSILSSPALSLDRLHIDAGSSLGPNISPEDRAEFLLALAPKVPHLELQGDRLLPRKRG